MSSNVSRRDVVRACKRRGWQIQPAAVAGILEHCRQDDDAEGNLLEDVLDAVGSKMAAGQRTVTANHWKRLLEEEGQEDDGDGGRRNGGEGAGRRQAPSASSSSSRSRPHRQQQQRNPSSSGDDELLQVVDAFRTPKLVYETMRKQFRIEDRPQSLFGTAEDKVNMLSQRYALIHQRLLRHELFRPSNLGHGSAAGGGSHQQHQHKLTPIESLLGKSTKNSASRMIILLAVLIQIEEGQYYLEDPTGQLPASFQPSALAAVDGFFVTENCILLVEGSFQDGILFVHRLGHPLLETRRDSLVAIQQQISHPAYSLPKLGAAAPDEEGSFVLLSDLHLDQPVVLQQLEGLLATYENYSPSRLPVFVMMGNFGSHSIGGGGGGSHLEELGSLLVRFPALARHAHFVLVPGPHDSTSSGAGQVVPYPNLLPRSGFGRVQNVHWASNPCRIRWRGKEMVVFRYDLLHLMQRQQVLLQEKKAAPESEEGDDDDEDQKHLRMPHCRLVKTILDQGHLIPVAGVPVYWNYSHALGLYPLPDVLVLGGDSFVAEGFHEIYGGCHVVHPGSMSRAGSYVNFSFESPLDEDDDEEEEEVGGGARVEFGNLGEHVQT